MNDTELDRLLDAWQAPMPLPSMRIEVRNRFPRSERRGFRRPLRWALAIALASVTLAVATEQSADTSWGGVFAPLRRLFNGIVEGIEARQASAMMQQARLADPRVYVDGELQTNPPAFGHAGSVQVQVPGDGLYWLMLFRPSEIVAGQWGQTGKLHGNILEFQAGKRHVRIVFDKSLANSDWPVYVYIGVKELRMQDPLPFQ